MKSMITALWERSQRKKQVEERLRATCPDWETRDHSEELHVSFSVGDPRDDGSGGGFYLTDDTSLLYDSPLKGDYGVSIAKNWRFEISVDSKSGRCLYATAFTSQLTAKKRALELPDSEKKTLIYRSDAMEPGLMEGITWPDNSVYFDSVKKILCIGDPDAEGEAVEFADRTVAVLDGGKLSALYMDLSEVKDSEENGVSLGNCLILV